MKTDVCFFSKRDSQGKLTGCLAVRVDDILFCGTPKFRKESITAIQTLRAGDIETLTSPSLITFTGLTIELGANRSITLSQQLYADELPTMDISEYVQDFRITNAKQLKSTFKQGLGDLIWFHQTRPDIGFAITQMATQLVEARESPEKARALANLYIKIVRFVKAHQRKIRYIRFPGSQRNSDFSPSNLLNWKLFVFTDAGFGAFVKSHSAESHVVILGDVIERDGVIKCHGLMLDHRCAKIHRVCRSTLSDEANAAVTAVDVALWFQVLLTEIFRHQFEYKRLTPPTEFPLLSPFNDSPPNEELQREESLRKTHRLFVTTHSQSDAGRKNRTFPVDMSLLQYINEINDSLHGGIESRRARNLHSPGKSPPGNIILPRDFDRLMQPVRSHSQITAEDHGAMHGNHAGIFTRCTRADCFQFHRRDSESRRCRNETRRQSWNHRSLFRNR